MPGPSRADVIRRDYLNVEPTGGSRVYDQRPYGEHLRRVYELLDKRFRDQPALRRYAKAFAMDEAIPTQRPPFMGEFEPRYAEPGNPFNRPEGYKPARPDAEWQLFLDDTFRRVQDRWANDINLQTMWDDRARQYERNQALSKARNTWYQQEPKKSR